MTHAELVTALTKPGEAILASLTPGTIHVLHMIVGVATEAGELLSEGKRIAFYDKPVDRENVVEELGDLEFYMQGLRAALGITREETLDYNIRKLNKRYPHLSYSDEDALARADKMEGA